MDASGRRVVSPGALVALRLMPYALFICRMPYAGLCGRCVVSRGALVALCLIHTPYAVCLIHMPYALCRRKWSSRGVPRSSCCFSFFVGDTGEGASCLEESEV
jgi:hypothetical protein